MGSFILSFPFTSHENTLSAFPCFQGLSGKQKPAKTKPLRKCKNPTDFSKIQWDFWRAVWDSNPCEACRFAQKRFAFRSGVRILLLYAKNEPPIRATRLLYNFYLRMPRSQLPFCMGRAWEGMGFPSRQFERSGSFTRSVPKDPARMGWVFWHAVRDSNP